MKKFCLIAVIFILFAGCAEKQKIRESGPATSLTSVALMPFEAETAGKSPEQIAACPVCGSSYRSGPIEPGADTILTDILWESLKETQGVKRVPPALLRGLWTEKTGVPDRVHYIQAMQKIGEEMGTDAVLYGRVFRYEERIGRWYSVERPASVAFDLHLISTRNGEILWKGRFDETQLSLTENLLNISAYLKRGFRWVTADELAREGIENVIKTLP